MSHSQADHSRFDRPSGHNCAVCGQVVDSVAAGYLVTAQSMTPRIVILRWSQVIAARNEVRAACSPEHTLEIVAHWVVSGRLDLNFTGAPQPTENKALSEFPIAHPHANQTIGELVINRESVRKLVANDPDALASVLDSLLEALLRDRNPALRKKPTLGVTAVRHTGIA